MRTIYIDYDESNSNYSTSYKGVVVEFRGRIDRKKSKRFFCGDIESDLKQALAFKRTGDAVVFRSSVDHFCFDFEGFHWEYTPEIGEHIVRDFKIDPIPAFQSLCKAILNIKRKNLYGNTN